MTRGNDSKRTFIENMADIPQKHLKRYASSNHQSEGGTVSNSFIQATVRQTIIAILVLVVVVRLQMLNCSVIFKQPNSHDNINANSKVTELALVLQEKDSASKANFLRSLPGATPK
jgi:hypothetical protein